MLHSTQKREGDASPSMVTHLSLSASYLQAVPRVIGIKRGINKQSREIKYERNAVCQHRL